MITIRKASLIWFYNDDNQILLQERWEYSKFWEEWAFWGGSIEEWETALEAFHREAKEELWLDMSEFDYDFIWEFIFDFPEQNKRIFRNIFMIKTNMLETDFTIYEWASAKFFDFEDAKKLKFMSDPSATLELIKNHILWKQ